MADFQTLSFDELCGAIEAIKKDTVILFHRNPDADAVGSAFALRGVLTELGVRAFCVCDTPVPSRLAFLFEAEQTGTSVDDIPADFTDFCVVTVDSASPMQLGSLAERFGGQIALMIDHHGKGERYADGYVDPDAAATGEILFDLVKRFATEEKITLNEALCTDLYAAISGDTGCFRYSNVTPATHKRAADLVASGIDCADINHRLFESNTFEQLRAEAAGISNLRLFGGGTVAVITFPYALKAALGLSDEHLETLVDVARSLIGVQVAIAIRQPGTEGTFRVSMRSNGDYDVAALCALFGGGGHKKAAGCTLTAADADEAAETIVEKIDFAQIH